MVIVLYVVATCFGAVILPSSGSSYQNFFKTDRNKTSHDKHTYVVVSVVEYCVGFVKIMYINVMQCW